MVGAMKLLKRVEAGAAIKENGMWKKLRRSRKIPMVMAGKMNFKTSSSKDGAHSEIATRSELIHSPTISAEIKLVPTANVINEKMFREIRGIVLSGDGVSCNFLAQTLRF